MHARELAKIPNVKISAYWNRTREKAEGLMGEFGGKYVAADFTRIANDPEIDAVYINTMHNDRLRILQVMAEAGKAVFMEKPLTHNEKSLVEMRRILERHPIMFQSGYKIRFNSLVEKARALLPFPEILTAHVLDEIWPDNSLNEMEIGGGNIRCQGVYAADILHLLAGSLPVAVTAISARRRHTSRVEDTLGAVYEFANGAVGTIAVADAGLATNGVSKFFAEAAGPNGAVTLCDRFKRLEWRASSLNTSETFTGEEDGFFRQSAAFIKTIREGAPVRCDFIAGAIPSIMIYRALESSVTGQRELIDVTPFFTKEKVTDIGCKSEVGDSAKL